MPIEPTIEAIDWYMVGFVALFVAICLVFVLAVLAFVFRFLRSRNMVPKSLNMVTLLVMVPRELREKEAEPKKEEKDIISVAETMFANLSAIKVRANWMKNLLLGRDYLSFELVAVKEEICFYVVTPRYLQSFIEKQIHSQYPKALVQEAGEYNIFQPKGFVKGTTLKFAKRYYLPIKTYKTLETDPLNALAEALSKLSEKEGACIQILIRPAPKGWAARGKKIARVMKQGKSFEEATGKNIFSEMWAALTKEVKRAATPEEVIKMRRAYGYEEEKPKVLTPMQEEMVKALEEKAGKLGFETNIRIVASSDTEEKAKMHLDNIVGAFTQFSHPYFNSFKSIGVPKKKLIRDFIFRYFEEGKKFICNTEELTSIYHFPTKYLEVPHVKWLLAKQAPPPSDAPKEGLLLGKNIYRGVETPVYIKDDDRRRHIYMIGMTGTGKSTLLLNMAVQDIKNGKGLCVIDPHGDLIEAILEHIPKERADDVILFDPSDLERPLGLNMLEWKRPEEKDSAVAEMIAIFYKLFPPEIIGPMFEHNMRNAMLTLMEDKEHPGTIAEIPRMFTDTDFQNYKLKKVKDPVVRAFWEKEMAKTSDFHKSEMLGYLISKVGRFVENEMMRNIIGQAKSAFDVREVMDEGKILLVNLCKGKVGEINSHLLGLILVSKIMMAALSRVDTPEKQRRDFYLYVDEFQNFVSDTFVSIIAEARKYRLNLIISHQFIGQLDEKMRDAVLGNAGTFTCYRIGVEDAEIAAKEFDPIFDQTDVINIERFNLYLRLMINNTASKPFSMAAFPPPPGGSEEVAKAVKELSRLKHGKEKKVIETEILERAKLGAPIREAAMGREVSL